MSIIVLNTDFKTLRQAYVEVKTFIEKELATSVPSINTQLVGDLGCGGDDNAELLEKFIKKYNLDVTGFNYSKHFLSEGEITNGGAALLAILCLPVIVVIWLINTLSGNTLKLRYPKIQRDTTDMTFGDMLTWYLTGKYNLRNDVVVRLMN